MQFCVWIYHVPNQIVVFFNHISVMKVRVGGKLQMIREERRLTQDELASILGLSTSTYARIERNETSVDLDKLVGFATILQVPIQDLLPETLSITNNNHNPGPGGGVIFGNQYFYLGETEALRELTSQLSALRSEIEALKASKEK